MTMVSSVVSAARTTLLPRAVMKVGLESATPNQRTDSAVGGKRAILSLPNATPTATTMGRLKKTRTPAQYSRKIRPLTAHAEDAGLRVEEGHREQQQEHAQCGGEVVVEENDLLVDEQRQDQRVAAAEQQDRHEAADGE